MANSEKRSALVAFATERDLIVDQTAIDRLGHVNNAIYLRWIESAVYDHWKSLATQAEFESYDWIAIRHEIDYQGPSFTGETLNVRTGITEIRRARAWFKTEICREGRPLVEALSCWGCIDTKSGRLTMIPHETKQRFLSHAR